jgi:transmembrane sensor
VVREVLTAERLRALPREEAAAYFVALRAPEQLSGGELQLFDQWLGADESHRNAFEAADRAWRSFDGGEDDEILDEMRRHARAARPAAWADWRRMAAAAAVVTIAVGVGLVAFPRWNLPQPGAGRGLSPSPPPTEYASARGQVTQVKLPDGTLMTLDADSAAVGRFSAQSRSIELTRGRAFFAVVHDLAHPFAVLAAGRRIVDVGTQFDVNLAAGELVVTLVEGRVTVAALGSDANPVSLAPGQQLVQRDGEDTVRTVGDDAQAEASWRTGLVTFDDQSLAEAVSVMNRYGRDQIVIRDPSVASLRVSGQFRAGQPSRFAQTLTEMYGLRKVHRGDEIELVKG